MNQLFQKVQIYTFLPKLLAEQSKLEMPAKILFKFEIKQTFLNFSAKEGQTLFNSKLTTSGHNI